MRSVMAHKFSQVPTAEIPRSSFDRSHGYKTTFDAGKLVPVFVDEALPGDTFSLRMTMFARLATPIVPFMDNLFCDTFFFAVPYRLVWSNWKKFNGEQKNPGDSTSYLVPTATAPGGGYAVGSLQDYMGLPTGIAGIVHDNLFPRAYNLIYNEWFRDQNLINSVTVDLGDGPDTPGNYTLLDRGKRHDYFTSCLPWPQKGTAVTLPLGTSAPVYGVHQTGANSGYALWQMWDTTAGARNTSEITKAGTTTMLATGGIPGANSSTGWQLATPADYAADVNSYPPYADLSAATASTINALRQAFQIQKLYERDARGGTRYTEIIRAHFGVVSPDARLQRPEYLGGGSTNISIHPIAQTSESATTPQGNLAAMGVLRASGHGFTKSFTEHCLIIGLVNVRADLNYQQGLNRMWSRQTRWDFYWPALSHIGEQAVLSQEIYADATGADQNVFGYQERYAEYRYKPSQITGLFRSTAAGTLDIWHLAQHFGTRPTLNSGFITENPPIARVVATPSEPAFLFDSFFQLKCARPMPVYGVPGLIDHF